MKDFVRQCVPEVIRDVKVISAINTGQSPTSHLGFKSAALKS